MWPSIGYEERCGQWWLGPNPKFPQVIWAYHNATIGTCENLQLVQKVTASRARSRNTIAISCFQTRYCLDGQAGIVMPDTNLPCRQARRNVH